MNKLVFFITALLLFSCTKDKDKYIAYAKFDEYRLQPSTKIERFTSDYRDYIMCKKNNNKISLLLMPDEREIVYELHDGFWYYSNKGDKERGTNSTNVTEKFIANDTIYTLETYLSDSLKIEWQGLLIKSKHKNFMISVEPFIKDVDVVNRFRSVKMLLDEGEKIEIYLKEFNEDTLFVYQTNNDKLNPIKTCIWSVDILDNLGEFGQNFYSADNITSWFVKKRPYWENCK